MGNVVSFFFLFFFQAQMRTSHFGSSYAQSVLKKCSNPPIHFSLIDQNAIKNWI